VGVDGRILLQRLEPAVRPSGSAERSHWDQRAPVAERSFHELLAQARRGDIESGRLLNADSLTEALPSEALPRIARALDLLEAHGSDRAVIVYADRTLVANVATRTIEGELLAHEGPKPEPVDAAVRVPTPDEDRSKGLRGPPQAYSVPADVLLALEARDSQN
jgi:hypothetical protein